MGDHLVYTHVHIHVGLHAYICDPLWEKVHFRAKCNIEIRVKIAEFGPNGGYMDYDTV